MSLETLLLYFFAAAALAGGVLMLLARHPMRVALALISSMISLAGIYAILGVHVIAVFQVLIYVGAVMVFMVYVIMLLDVRDPAFLERYGRAVVPFEVRSVTRHGVGEPSHTKEQANGVRLYIGRADRNLPHGLHRYEIRYRTDWQLGFFADRDELYWNVTGNGWDFPVDEAAAQVFLPGDVPAGTRWHYSTGETNLVGILVGNATKKPLSEYLSEKIWKPAGMEQQATWILSRTGKEISGCCIQAATRDFARFGLFVLNGARVDGQSIVPDGWLAEATTGRTGIGVPGRGYGYQWWTYADGSFSARGIFGQGIFIDPKRKIVIASNANWGGGARDPVASEAREAFYRTVQKAIDDEAAASRENGQAR